MSAPTWLSPVSGSIFNYTPELGWNAVYTWDWCLDVIKYEIVVMNVEGIVASGTVSWNITNWNPSSDLPDWQYVRYVKVYDNKWWSAESNHSMFEIDRNIEEYKLQTMDSWMLQYL